ncbi:30S ribosomal protein S3 [Myxococcota bacterium]|nr:30S ribosomal protein S3 [Myxococcota bacterium]MBU1411275.1 30S ribosomal protein S3 [Myxococcota bacterium]MBU1509650.1 30S ribosomal protein S3 [Myxococcota bacterium]PKN25817.1 MAG: 30S ribosomal protein S3 [Deltaproteobacteria bacterium HGW-Deltaproteobacteria-22]
MGQKVHPVGLRLGIIRTWSSKWYSEKDYSKWLVEDLKIREFIFKRMPDAGIAAIEVERRTAEKMKVIIVTASAGKVIGKGGANVEKLRKDLQGLSKSEIFVDIKEVKRAETNAQLVAENIARQLERRVNFRRAMKKSIQTSMQMGVKGIKVYLSGRLGGAEIARREWYMEGRVPLHTLRADIDYGTATARTTYGAIGVKCWIYNGDVLSYDSSTERGW